MPAKKTQRQKRSESHIDVTALHDAKEIVRVLGDAGVFDLIEAIQELGEDAYLAKLERELEEKISRPTVAERLSDLVRIGFVTAAATQDKRKRLVLQYKITQRGYSILKMIENLPLANEKGKGPEDETSPEERPFSHREEIRHEARTVEPMLA